MTPKKLNIGIIGYGFMGRAHSNAYLKVNKFFDLPYEPVLKVASARKADKLEAFAKRWGWERTETDWRRLVESDDVDVVDISSPNDTHHEIALAAIAAGKIVVCEKPLAMNVEQAREMTEAMEKSGRPSMVWFNYRRMPAPTLARRIIEEERLGRIFHYRARYLQDWTINPDLPQGGKDLWRLDVNVAGSGVLGDLLSHSIDMALWLNGPIESVAATSETFIRERPMQDEPDRIMPVGIDDACMFLARFANGSLSTFESTRYARGRKNENMFEINGARGSMLWNIENAHELLYFNHGDEDHLRGWRNIQVWGKEHPYMTHWWEPGCVIGYEHSFVHAAADFLESLETGKKSCPDFRDALDVQIVMDTVQKASESQKWEKVPS